MLDFAKIASPKETWFRKLSSSSSYHEPNLGWFISFSKASDVTMDLENSTLRHQAVNEDDKTAKIAGVYYNPNGVEIVSNQQAEKLSWESHYAAPDQNSSVYCNSAITIEKNVIEASDEVDRLPKIFSSSPTPHFQQKPSNKIANLSSTKLGTNIKGPRRRGGPRTVKELLEHHRKRQRMMERCQHFYAERRRNTDISSFQYTSHFTNPMGPSSVALENNLSNLAVQAPSGLHQKACTPFANSSMYSNTVVVSSQSEYVSEYSSISSEQIYSNSWSSSAINDSQITNNFNFSTTAGFAPTYQCHDTVQSLQVPPSFELPQITQVFRSDDTLASSVSQGSYSPCEVDRLTQSEIVPCTMANSHATSFQRNAQSVYDSNLADFFNSVRNGDIPKLTAYLNCHPYFATIEDSHGKVPLFYAIEDRQVEVIKLLIHFQADLRLVARDGSTIFHFAARCPTEDILIYLLNCLKPEDVQSLLWKRIHSSGSTATHEATRLERSRNLFVLLQHGADPLARDNRGMSALHTAVYNCDYMSVETIINFVKNPLRNPDLSPLQGNPSNDCFRYNLKTLLSQTTSQHDWTPLHFATDRLQKLKPDQISTRHQIIKMLLMHDANPSAFNSEGKTPDQLLPHSTVSNTISAIYRLFVDARERRLSSEEQYFDPCDVLSSSQVQN